MLLTDEQLLDIYDIVFSNTHSDGFKKSEVKDLLFESDYWFMEEPKDNWKINLKKYLNRIDYDRTQLDMNPAL